MVLQKKILLSAFFIIMLPFLSKGQMDILHTGKNEVVASGTFYIQDIVSDVYARNIYVYPNEVFDELEDGDYITGIDFQRYAANESNRFEVIGNTNVKIYLKTRDVPELGSDEINWASEISDAELVFDGPVNEIFGENEGWKHFHFKNVFEYDEQDGQHIQVMFESYNELIQDGQLLNTETSSNPSSGIEEYGPEQAYLNVGVGEQPTEVNEVADGYRPDIQLYKTNLEEEATMTGIRGPEIWPVNNGTFNNMMLQVKNEGIKELNEVNVTIEAEGALNFKKDTVISQILVNRSHDLFMYDLPSPDLPGEVRYTAYIDEIGGITQDTATFTQKASLNTFGFSNRDEADGLLEINNSGYFFQAVTLDNDPVVNGIKLYIGDNAELVGETTYGVIFDSDLNKIEETDPYLIRNDDRGTFVELLFNQPVELQNKKDYLFGAFAREGVSMIPVINYEIPLMTSYFKAQGGNLNSFQNNRAFLVKGILDAEGYVAASVAEPQDGVCETDQQELVVNVANHSGAEQSDFEVTADISGENADTVLSATYDGALSEGENDELTLGYFNSIATGDVTITIEIEDEEIAPEEAYTTDITFNELPDPGFSWEADGLEVSFQANLDDLDIYHWDMGDGNTSEIAAPVHTYSDDDTYQVTLTVTNDEGCENSETREVEVEGIENLLSNNPSAEFGLNVYPNPAQNEINGTFYADAAKSYKVQLLDVTGSIHIEQEINPNFSGEHTFSMNLENAQLNSGSYILMIEDGGNFTRKLIFVE